MDGREVGMLDAFIRFTLNCAYLLSTQSKYNLGVSSAWILSENSLTMTENLFDGKVTLIFYLNL